jgi:hypothetical protein
MGKSKKIQKPPAQSSSRFKAPESQPKLDSNSLKPAFSFRHIKYQGCACLSKCEPHEKTAIADKLLLLSQLTWNVIHTLPRDTMGCEHIPYSQFKVSLPPIVTQETTLLVFRFSEPGRMAGFRIQDTYHIVALGAQHELY